MISAVATAHTSKLAKHFFRYETSSSSEYDDDALDEMKKTPGQIRVNEGAKIIGSLRDVCMIILPSTEKGTELMTEEYPQYYP